MHALQHQYYGALTTDSGYRDEALKVVLDLTSDAGLVHVARHLYQLEVLLLQSSMPSKKVSKASSRLQ